MLSASRARRAAAGILVWMVFVLGAPAFAQGAKVEVAPDTPVVLARVAGKVTAEAEAAGASVLKVENGNAVTLIYLPPKGVSQLEDKVTFTLDGTPQDPIAISVRAPAPTLAGEYYQVSFKALFVLFILAVLLESGLALLFRWRPFLAFFDSRSANPLLAFVFSLLLVRLFDLDIVTSLVNIYTGAKHPPDWSGSLLTAMIIAGGSAGVNRIFQNLGFRPVSAQEQPQKPQLQDTEAWVSVTLVRDKSVGPVDVLIKNAVAGTISGGASPKGSFLRHFIRDKGRFPQSGGHTVVPGTDYVIELQGKDAQGAPLPKDRWGPYPIAPRAVIDIELRA